MFFVNNLDKTIKENLSFSVSIFLRFVFDFKEKKI